MWQVWAREESDMSWAENEKVFSHDSTQRAAARAGRLGDARKASWELLAGCLGETRSAADDDVDESANHRVATQRAKQASEGEWKKKQTRTSFVGAGAMEESALA